MLLLCCAGATVAHAQTQAQTQTQKQAQAQALPGKQPGAAAKPVAAASADAPSNAGAPARPDAAPVAAAAASRDWPELAADRPGLGDASGVVGDGIWQFETGVVLDAGETGGLVRRQMTVPLAVVRVGLTRRLEVRAGADGVTFDVRRPAGLTTATGRSDILLGAKWQLIERGSRGTEVALSGALSVPAGSERMTSHGYDPDLRVAWSRDLPHDYELSGNVSVTAATLDRGQAFQRAVSLAIGHRVAAGWDSFVEVYAASRLEPDDDDIWVIDGGLTHALGPHGQLDVNIGRSLARDTVAWFIGAGIVVRGMF